jgi:hypothetical protein
VLRLAQPAFHGPTAYGQQLLQAQQAAPGLSVRRRRYLQVAGCAEAAWRRVCACVAVLSAAVWQMQQ